MKKKMMIVFDLKDKSKKEKTRIQQKLYDHREKSNYGYEYERKGLLSKFKYVKERKTVLAIENKEDLFKIAEILKELQIEFQIMEGK